MTVLNLTPHLTSIPASRPAPRVWTILACMLLLGLTGAAAVVVLPSACSLDGDNQSSEARHAANTTAALRDAPPSRWALGRTAIGEVLTTADRQRVADWAHWLAEHPTARATVTVIPAWPAAAAGAPPARRQQAAVLRLLAQDGIDPHRVRLAAPTEGAATASPAYLEFGILVP